MIKCRPESMPADTDNFIMTIMSEDGNVWSTTVRKHNGKLMAFHDIRGWTGVCTKMIEDAVFWKKR